MKKAIFIQLFVTSIFFAGLNTSAQRGYTVTGDVSVIKNAKQMNLIFNYDQMTVGEFSTEDAYIEARAQEYEKKKQGGGDEWIREWKEIKENAENVFVEIFNKKLSKKYGFTLSQDQGGEPTYTLVFNMTSLEIGWSAGLVVSDPASLIFDLWVCKTSDLQKPIASIVGFGIGDAGLVKNRIKFVYMYSAVKISKILSKRMK